MKVLALSGSIRSSSSNAALLKAIRQLFHFSDAQWTNFEIKNLPFFDPDLQFSADLPQEVRLLREIAAEADFLVIATPEYAHGIPGILKNALEWLVCEETMKKNVLVFICTSGGGEHVKTYLLETLKTMDLVVSEERVLTVMTARQHLSVTGEIQNSDFRQKLLDFLTQFWKI